MLLRRMTQHVKDQNWFAVGLDFAIVVLGVFLGIQIGNWNDDAAVSRKAQVLERQLVVELSDDILDNRLSLRYFQDVQKSGEAALADIEGPSTLSDEDFIIKAFRATQFDSSRARRFAFAKIIELGLADRIKDQALFGAANGFYISEWVGIAAQEARTSTYRRLFRETVPLNVQRDVRLNCGDPNAPQFSSYREAMQFYEPDAVVLDYSCKLTLPAQQIVFAANALRQADGLEPALRLRIGELDNTNALIARDDKAMTPWRLTPDAHEAAIKARDAK
jgi:hypothetical protein